MLWRVWLAVGSVAIGACRASDPRPPEPAAIAVGDAGPAEPSPRPALPALVGPPEVACTFVVEKLQLAVAFEGEGPPFATVVGATGPLSVASGPATHGAFLAHGANGFHLRGWTSATKLDLFARRPIAFGAWVFPRSTAVLRWTSATPGMVDLRVDEPARDGHQTTVTFREDPRAMVPCTDVAPRSGEDIDTMTFLLRGRKGTVKQVRAGEPIPIAREPGSAPVGDIHFTHPAAAEVTVVERRGASSLVIVDAWEPATLYGWIADSFLVPPTLIVDGGHHSHAPKVRMRVDSKKNRRRVACEQPVRIVADIAGRRAFVGEIDARTPFVFIIDEGADGFRELELETDGIYAEARARLVADRSAVEACPAVASAQVR